MNKLTAYKELVKKYHATLDLVSDGALEHFDDKIADARIYAEFIKTKAKPGATILDVGSGAGLPGIVLSIDLPDNPIYLVERRQKRAAFLKIAVSQLELKNAQAFGSDVMELNAISADVVTALAVGSFSLLYCLTRHLHSSSILLMSRKGDDYAKEIVHLEKTLGKPAKILTHPNVSRETIYGNLVAIECVGGLECSAGLSSK